MKRSAGFLSGTAFYGAMSKVACIQRMDRHSATPTRFQYGPGMVLVFLSVLLRIQLRSLSNRFVRKKMQKFVA